MLHEQGLLEFTNTLLSGFSEFSLSLMFLAKEPLGVHWHDIILYVFPFKNQDDDDNILFPIFVYENFISLPILNSEDRVSYLFPSHYAVSYSIPSNLRVVSANSHTI